MATFKQYELKNGTKKWLFQTYVGTDDVTGKEIRTTRRGFDSKREAVLQEKRLVANIDPQNKLNKENNITFKEVAEMWLENYQHTVKPSTYSRTLIFFNSHIYKELGHLRIGKIKTISCQTIINKWSKEMTKQKYKLCFNYVERVFKYAINMNIIANNPTTNVIVPKNSSIGTDKIRKVDFFELNELELILDTIQQEENETERHKFYSLFRLLAFSGCRIGEVLALSWEDVDFPNSSISITKTVSYADQKYISETPKTKKSNRIVPLDNKTMQALKRWKQTQRLDLLKNGYNSTSYIFNNKDNSFYIGQNIQSKLNKYQRKADMRLTALHIFRHSHASALLQSGATLKEVSERLGHSSINITADTYIHLTEKDKQKTIDRLANFANF